jgi:uncharacterized protein
VGTPRAREDPGREPLPGEILRLAAAGAFELVLSAPILAELHDVLHRPRIQKRLGAEPQRVALEYAQAIYAAGRMVTDLPDVHLVESDPKDDHVVAAALAAEADYLVSGDQDLLTLGTVGGIRCIAPAAFLAMLREGAQR